jgi:hypothetical protein
MEAKKHTGGSSERDDDAVDISRSDSYTFGAQIAQDLQRLTI